MAAGIMAEAGTGAVSTAIAAGAGAVTGIMMAGAVVGSVATVDFMAEKGSAATVGFMATEGFTAAGDLMEAGVTAAATEGIGNEFGL
jgi:hypothetical protein